jgi:hypothetical protein
MHGNLPRAGRALLVVAALALVAAACGDDATTPTTRATETTTATTAGTTAAAPAVTTTAVTTTATTEATTYPIGGGIDATLTRDDVDCSEEGLTGGEDTLIFLNAHYVVDGNLGSLCFGDEDPTLIQAWQILSAITPGGQLNDLALFAGFIEDENDDSGTLAFVNALDDFGSAFQMSVNLNAADDDQNEFMLTMAHEFSHVFTALPFELDRSVEPQDCLTYYNGEGCYTDDSLMADWIATFWGDGLIDEIDPYADASPDDGQARCDANPGFLGAYAASSPEEDFAESFSAFVFQLPMYTPETQDKMDWFAQQPGLVEFQTRAAAAGLGPLENNFDDCGLAA